MQRISATIRISFILLLLSNWYAHLLDVIILFKSLGYSHVKLFTTAKLTSYNCSKRGSMISNVPKDLRSIPIIFVLAFNGNTL
jgi:hypothetical protein